MKKILLIEDNEDVRQNTAEILELSGYQVFSAGDGKEGVEMAFKELPDLIICDIMMPVLDGYGVLNVLSKNVRTGHIPFIFLTAKSEKSDLRKGMGLGADDYITKPFDGTELLNAVEARLKKSESLQQMFAGDSPNINAFLDGASRASGIKLTSEERLVNSYTKKQILFKEGQRPVAVYFVMSGKVLVRKSNENNKEFVTDILVPGDFLGYIPILEDVSYRETAEVIEDAELMIIPRKDFVELLTNSSEVAHQFIKLLAKNVVEKEERLIDLAYNSLRKKVANALLHVTEKFKGDGNAIEISRENLANIVGSATESLIRTLGDFKTQGLIDIKGSSIIILDAKRLANIIG